MFEVVGLCADLCQHVAAEVDAISMREAAIDAALVAAVAEVGGVVLRAVPVKQAPPKKGGGLRAVIDNFKRALRSRFNRNTIQSAHLDQEDVLQEALLKAWKANPDAVRMQEIPASHVQTITKHAVIDGARSASRRAKRFSELSDRHVDPKPIAQEMLEDRSDEVARRKAAEDLRCRIHRGPYQAKPWIREALERVAAGDSYAEAARVAGVPTSTVTRARDRLVAAMERERASSQIQLWCAP